MMLGGPLGPAVALLLVGLVLVFMLPWLGIGLLAVALVLLVLALTAAARSTGDPK